MKALMLDEINWLIRVVKRQTDLAPENERKLKLSVLAYLEEIKTGLESAGANSNRQISTTLG